MVEGELVQLTKLGQIDLTEQDALELAARKTACLFAGCARLGAVLGKLDDAGEQAMADYGHFAGLAFQLVDDVLDFTASPEQLGKPVLSDLKEGKVTLPLIYAMETAGAEARQLVQTVLDEKGFETVRPEQITTLVHKSGALDRTRAAALDFSQRAKACLNGNAPESDFARALRTVPDFILGRDN
jgi:octaprenyl-diphosphate synthase